MSALLTFGTGAVVGVLSISGYKQWFKSRLDSGSSTQLVMTDDDKKTKIVDVRIENSAKKSQLTENPQAAKETQPKAKPGELNELTGIEGVGRVYAKRLHAAGIRTCADLATASAEHIQDIVAPKPGSRRPNVDTWIKQAQQLVTA